MRGSSSLRETTCFLVVLALAACGGSSKGKKAPTVDAGSDVTAPASPDAGADSSSRDVAEASPPDQADSLGADAALDAADAYFPDSGSPDVALADTRATDVAAETSNDVARKDVAGSDVVDGARDGASTQDAVTGLDEGAGLANVTYTADPDTIFANPERGFYAVFETTASSYESLDRTTVQSLRTQTAVSLVYRQWYLDSFVNADLTQAFLDKVTADFSVIRQAGMKTVLRFAYTDNATKPYGDANKARVLGHIAQLKPILFANSDVIAALQAGFIGAWGEWYYTDYFGDNGTVSAAQWTDRQDVVNALLDSLDLQRPIQLRTPAYKQHFYGTAALTTTEAFSGVAKARVGHHDDCFVADATDMGTYNNITSDKAYLATENLYLPQGGETCATSAYSVWSNASQDMASMHWSFLNQDYHPDVLASWGANIDIAKRELGYRLSLVSGSFSTQAKIGGQFMATFTMRNDGYAAPFNPRGLNLILRNTSSGSVYVAKLPDDPRRFAPGTTTAVSHTFCLPADFVAGTYAYFLSLPDPVPTLAGRPEYAIRLANTSVWDATTGWNNLGSGLVVSPTFNTPACAASDIAVALNN
jgi:Domain of unknown function (DUF4832)/Domain of unknown function (DUF4874)